jgi:uncharacterized protein YegP (UPF0339 family)
VARATQCGRRAAGCPSEPEAANLFFQLVAKFEISKDHAGKFRFHLKAPNGEIIAASQGYETKASAEKGIEAIKTHAPSAKVEDHTDAKSS